MSKTFLLFATSIFLQLIELHESKCPYSVPTIEKVHTCPKSEKEAIIASTMKNCKTLANVQNCTDPSKFVYHCVPNTWQNESLEVCAPKIFSQGHCVEFNMLGQRIQELEQTCYNDEDNKCPKRFNSSDQYLYISCFRKKNDAVESKETYIPSEEKIDIDSIFLILIFSIMVFAVIGVILWFFRKRLPCRKKHDCSETEKIEEVDNIKEKMVQQTPDAPNETRVLSETSMDSEGTTKTQATRTTSLGRLSRIHHDQDHQPNSDVQNVCNSSLCNSDVPLLSQSFTIDNVPQSESSLFSRTSCCNIYQSEVSSLIPPSEVSSRPRVREAEGYDTESLAEFVDEFNLSDLYDRLKEHGFNCIAPVLILTQQEMTAIGFKVGEIKRCQLAINDYLQKREQKRITTDAKVEEEEDEISKTTT